MLLILDHSAEIIGETARDQKDGEHLKKVRHGCRVLVRMGGGGLRNKGYMEGLSNSVFLASTPERGLIDPEEIRRFLE
jgi:hypothetical protein